MNNLLPIGYSVRLAIVKKVERTHVVCDFFDRVGEKSIRCPLPHPYAGRGGGIFVGIERNTLVLVANGPGQKLYIVGLIPDINFYSDVFGQTNIRTDESSYPEIEEGEIAIKANSGQYINLSQNGNIAMDAGIGNAAADIELSKLTQCLFLRPSNIYKFTEAGRSIDGVVKRDLNEEDDTTNISTIDLLNSETYDTFLSNIGRSPYDEVNKSSAFITRQTIRNPSLVEKHDIIYEYADSFDVNDLEVESNAMAHNNFTDDKNNFSDPVDRKNRRTDILNLNLKNFNHLIEKVQGTVVDIYGNILDINRGIIPVPGVETIDIKSGNSKLGLQKVYSYLRRSIKYHMEINARKNIDDSEPSESLLGQDNGKAFGKWSVDIDGEGLTKINIPASSETGNIPVLGRYINSKNDDPTFKDPDKVDIRLSQFGESGQNIVDSAYAPKVFDEILPAITAGTAYHSILNIASSIFNNGKLKNPSPTIPFDQNNSINPVVDKIDNGIDSTSANAGGKSLHMNLDGSAEISIGADTADRKSMVMDLAGGMISHFGRDNNGRSIIHQSDGDIIIQIGGAGVDDSRFTDNSKIDRPGRVEIHLNRPGGTSQKIIIDEDGISLDIQGNGIISTSGDLTLSAGGRLLLNAELIEKYGSFDSDTRAVIGSEIAERRKGRSN